MPEVEVSQTNTTPCVDGGWGSRKFWLAVFAMSLISGLGLLGSLAAFSGLGVNLPTLVGGILGALGIYSGANVGVRAVHSKAKVLPKAEPKKD